MSIVNFSSFDLLSKDVLNVRSDVFTIRGDSTGSVCELCAFRERDSPTVGDVIASGQSCSCFMVGLDTLAGLFRTALPVAGIRFRFVAPSNKPGPDCLFCRTPLSISTFGLFMLSRFWAVLVLSASPLSKRSEKNAKSR